MSSKGRKLTLLRTHYSLSAYKDQMDIVHPGYIVDEVYHVEITEIKSVKGIWGNGIYEGWKAVTEDGKEFFCNWHSFPDDSMTPTVYWQDDKHEYEDSQQVLGFHFAAYVNPDGTKFVL